MKTKMEEGRGRNVYGIVALLDSDLYMFDRYPSFSPPWYGINVDLGILVFGETEKEVKNKLRKRVKWDSILKRWSVRTPSSE